MQSLQHMGYLQEFSIWKFYDFIFRKTFIHYKTANAFFIQFGNK